MTLEQFLDQSAAGLPHGSVWMFAVAALAGIVASAVCPCTLPVGIGVVGVAGAEESQRPRAGFGIAISFFAGIVVNLMVLGALAGRLGAVMSESFGRYWTAGMALLTLVGAGVAFLGPRLKVDQLAALRRPGLAGAFGYGFAFSLGTSAAPLLVLMTFATAQGSPLYGTGLALAFGIGRGLPFLLVGVFAGALMRFVHFAAWRRGVQIGSGCVLLLVSAYYLRALSAFL
ncbi:MAG: thiol:disulfide interchange protein [Verrucomicrobia bacterium 61-8]|nr:thiol:disulfide interchange protein [Verrucomicrobiota bacterium]OJU98642.1 MAG: thiol:disulfide interchange protein [Verrucomicrobia bacterium 61-8]